MTKKNEMVLVNMGDMLVKHGEALNALGVTASNFNTMAVVKRSNILKKEKTGLEAELAASCKEAKRLAASLDKELTSVADKYAKKVLPAWQKFAKLAGMKKPAVVVSASVHNNKIKMCAEYRHQEDGSHYSTGTSADTTTPLTACVKNLIHTVKSNRGESECAQRRIMEIRVALQNTGELEREANATTTHVMLSQTAEGAQILKGLGLTDLC